MKVVFLPKAAPICLLVTCTIFWPGCASNGATDKKAFPEPRIPYEKAFKAFPERRILSQIKPGESTKADVKALLGEPFYVTFTDAKQELWTYFYITIDIKPGATPHFIWEYPDEELIDAKHFMITIIFSKEGAAERLLKAATEKGKRVFYYE